MINRIFTIQNSRNIFPLHKIDFRKSLFFQKIFILSLYFLSNISAEENTQLLKRAADLFQKEKREIRNYRVKQEVTSKIKEGSTIITEQRIQIGYFKNPDEYIFVTKEIDVNGLKQFLPKALIERTNKREVDWLSQEGLKTHSFQVLSSDFKSVKYLVNPLKIQAGYYRGQIWINQQNAKIIKILKEPIIKKREVMKYLFELDFEHDYLYQAPSQTHLTAFYQKENQTTEIKVDVIFKEYQFNFDLDETLKIISD